MNTSLSNLFLIYLMVFLAVVVLAWLAFTWRQYRLKLKHRRHGVCSHCGKLIPLETPTLWITCPHCGATHKRQQLKEK